MASRINKEWHLKHPMPKNPTMDERLVWHLAHMRSCQCRNKLPDSIMKEIRKRGMKI